MHTITPTRLSSQIKKNMRAQINTMIWGGPGIGKSDIPQQIANDMGVKLLDFRANLFDPVDVRGIPHLRQIKETGDRYTSWAPPDIFPIESRDGAKGIMLIDELPTAPPATQNAFLQLLLTREVGNYKMPIGWSVISAGNRITDGAAVYQMPTPVRNRLAHYELEPTLDDWVTWAYQNNIDTDVIAFIQYRPNLLNAFDADQYAFPTPRTWAFVSKKLGVSDTNDDIDELFYDVSSLVGDGPAGEFVAFKEIANKLPDLDSLIADPNLYKKDDNPALLYALANGLAAKADDPKMENIMKINKKMPIEFQVVLIKACLTRDKALISHPDIDKWVSDNANVIL